MTDLDQMFRNMAWKYAMAFKAQEVFGLCKVCGHLPKLDDLGADVDGVREWAATCCDITRYWSDQQYSRPMMPREKP